MPRDMLDVVICVSVAAVQLLALVGLPAGVTVLATGNADAGTSVALGVLLVWLLFSVRYIRCDGQGLHLKRVLGSPKLIPWGQIDSVEEASRRELVLRGWLWPLFPAREMTTSLTAQGHYRIRFKGRDLYYPPGDSAQFLSAIRAGRDLTYSADTSA